MRNPSGQGSILYVVFFRRILLQLIRVRIVLMLQLEERTDELISFFPATKSGKKVEDSEDSAAVEYESNDPTR